MAGLWSAAVRCNLYSDGNTTDQFFLANVTWGLNNHIWWEKRERGTIPRTFPRQWSRPYGMGGREIHHTKTSKVTRAWSESNKLYQSVPPNPGGIIIC